ncbi:hypothetical protein B0H14DRAFT_284492 [Mycena olivaceomarginata]|nr:hypothetical protein B0H14DRAFT_284492 [Mycena olivaceomarginata]
MTMADLFQRIEDRRDAWNVEVMVAFLEIYNEEIRDLLTNDPGHRGFGELQGLLDNLHSPGQLGPYFFATHHRCKGGNDFPTLIFIRIEAVDGQHVYFRWVSAANLQNPAQVVAFEHAAVQTRCFGQGQAKCGEERAVEGRGRPRRFGCRVRLPRRRLVLLVFVQRHACRVCTAEEHVSRRLRKRMGGREREYR